MKMILIQFLSRVLSLKNLLMRKKDRGETKNFSRWMSNHEIDFFSWLERKNKLPFILIFSLFMSGLNSWAQEIRNEVSESSLIEKINKLTSEIERFESAVGSFEERNKERGPSKKIDQSKDLTKKDQNLLPSVNLFDNPGSSENVSQDSIQSNPELSQLGGGVLKVGNQEKNPYPQVEEIVGEVSYYNVEQGQFTVVSKGFLIQKPILFLTTADSSFVVSFPGKIAARVAGNSRVVLSPVKNGRYEADLRLGTISALLDPLRDKKMDPGFAVRTMTGVTEATGTFYAVTEYKGQAYTSVKKGNVVKKTTPSAKPNFNDYLNKPKPKPKPLSKK